jgi:hypothetical protein
VRRLFPRSVDKGDWLEDADRWDYESDSTQFFTGEDSDFSEPEGSDEQPAEEPRGDTSSQQGYAGWAAGKAYSGLKYVYDRLPSVWPSGPGDAPPGDGAEVLGDGGQPFALLVRTEPGDVPEQPQAGLHDPLLVPSEQSSADGQPREPVHPGQPAFAELDRLIRDFEAGLPEPQPQDVHAAGQPQGVHAVGQPQDMHVVEPATQPPVVREQPAPDTEPSMGASAQAHLDGTAFLSISRSDPFFLELTDDLERQELLRMVQQMEAQDWQDIGGELQRTGAVADAIRDFERAADRPTEHVHRIGSAERPAQHNTSRLVSMWEAGRHVAGMPMRAVSYAGSALSRAYYGDGQPAQPQAVDAPQPPDMDGLLDAASSSDSASQEEVPPAIFATAISI